MTQSQKKYIINQLVSNNKRPSYKIGDIVLYVERTQSIHIIIKQYKVISARALMNVDMDIDDITKRDTRWTYEINDNKDGYIHEVNEEDIVCKI